MFGLIEHSVSFVKQFKTFCVVSMFDCRNYLCCDLDEFSRLLYCVMQQRMQ